MGIKPALNQFNGGEISPNLEGRTDWDKYNYSAKLCKNFIPLVEGSLIRRGGSHFIGFTKDKEKNIIGFSIYLNKDVTPILTVNGTKITSFSKVVDGGNYIFSTSVEFTDGQEVKVVIEADGYVTLEDTFYSPDTSKEYHLVEKSVGNATLTVIKSKEDIGLTINGTNTNPYTTFKGNKVIIIATYNGNSTSDAIYLNEDITISINIVNGKPQIAKENEPIVSAGTRASGTAYLGAGRYRVTAVGGGGFALYCGPEWAWPWQNGDSGATVDAEFNLQAGEYSWQCGKKSSIDWDVIGTIEEKREGEPSFLKLGSANIVEASGGTSGYYTKIPVARYDTSKATKVYIAQNGTKGAKNGGPQAMSALGEYGAGAVLISIKESGDDFITETKASHDGLLKITYLGALDDYRI